MNEWTILDEYTKIILPELMRDGLSSINRKDERLNLIKKAMDFAEDIIVERANRTSPPFVVTGHVTGTVTNTGGP